MNSLKNSIVAILLLGVSYGVYQVITSPDIPTTSTAEFHAQTAQPTIEIPSGNDAEKSSPLQLDSAKKSIADWAAPIAEMPRSSATQPEVFPPRNFASPTASQSNTGTPPLLNPESRPVSPPVSPNRFEQGTKELLGQASPRPTVSTPESNFPSNFNPSTPPVQSFPSDTSKVVLSGGTSPLPTFDSALLSATQLANSGQFRQALVELSPHVNDTALVTADRDTLMAWLDALAAKVIYSTEHHVESAPYIVQANDTLETIARQWNVPQQLIVNINREKILDRAKLQPGSELKKVTGPFRAEMDCTNHMVTLFVGDLYAGRFPMIGKASDVPSGGTFQITQKSAQGNSQGEFWIGTGNPALSLHAQQPAGSQSGCEFSETDARDLFSILNVGSEIKILR